MADYSFIAKGLQPIDIATPLLQVEEIRRARAQEVRQNALLEVQRQNMEMDRQRMVMAQDEARRKQSEADSQSALRNQIPVMEAAIANGQFAGWLEGNPDLKQFAPYANDPNFVEAMRRTTYARAGIDLPSGPLQLVELSGGIRALTQDGKVIGSAIQPRESKVTKPPSGYTQNDDGTLSFIPGGPGDPTLDLARSYRTSTERKRWNDVSTGYAKIQQAATAEPTAANDLSLIFQFMKMLDPGSTVREGEFANAQNAAGVPDRIRNLFNNVKEGTRLTPDQRKEFLEAARRAYEGERIGHASVVEPIAETARQYGINPKSIIPDIEVFSQTPQVPSGSTGSSAGAVSISTDAEYDKLPSGTLFVAPDGTTRRKP